MDRTCWVNGQRRDIEDIFKRDQNLYKIQLICIFALTSYRIPAALLRISARMLGIRWSVRGLQNVDNSRGAVVLLNHQTSLDLYGTNVLLFLSVNSLTTKDLTNSAVFESEVVGIATGGSIRDYKAHLFNVSLPNWSAMWPCYREGCRFKSQVSCSISYNVPSNGALLSNIRLVADSFQKRSVVYSRQG